MPPPQIPKQHQETIHQSQNHQKERKGESRNRSGSRSETRRQCVVSHLPFLNVRFAETLEKECKLSNLPEAIFKNVTNINEGQLTGHMKGNPQRGLNLIIHQILYIDNGAFFFETRDNVTLGLDLINKFFAKLGLEMNIGRGEQLSKTKIMYSPKAFFYQSPKNNNASAALLPKNIPLITSPADDTTDDNNTPLTTQIPKNSKRRPSPQ
jgi:hypothetical protein